MTHRRLAAPALAIFAIVLASPAAAVAASPSPSVSAPSSASPSQAPASPTTYAAVNPSLVVSSGSVTVGGHVTVSGSGFNPNEPVDISVSYASPPKAAGSTEKSGYVIAPASFVRQAQPMQVAADTAGAFSEVVVLSQAGMATITATGTVSQRSSTSTVDVLAHAAVGAAAPQSPEQAAQDALQQHDADAVGRRSAGAPHRVRRVHRATPTPAGWPVGHGAAPARARTVRGRLRHIP